MTQMQAAMQAAINGAVRSWFPNFEEMTEDQLQPIVESLGHAGSVKNCPYSGQTFGPHNQRFVMLNDDGSFAVAQLDYMVIRSLRDNLPYADWNAVQDPIFARYEALRKAREEEKKRIEEERRRREETIMKIATIASKLARLNQVDGLDILPKHFDDRLIKIAKAKPFECSDDDILLYLEQVNNAPLTAQGDTSEEPTGDTENPAGRAEPDADEPDKTDTPDATAIAQADQSIMPDSSLAAI